jgi:hypothetical protein
MMPERILNITKGANNKHFKRVMLRNKWVGLLNSRVQKSGMTEAEKNDVLSWSKNTIIDQALYQKITCHF